MRHLPRLIMDWLERGDLVPLIVLVSAVHYAVILSGHDLWPVAIAIGILVDLGHYRWVRAAVRYQGNNQRERFARWALALVMTGISLAYQQRFYGDWFYSVPLPLLIISLAWLGEKDKRQVSFGKPVSANGESVQSAEYVHASDISAEPVEKSGNNRHEPMRYICLQPGCTWEGKTQNAWNGHQKKHKPVKDNRQETSIISNNGHKEKI